MYKKFVWAFYVGLMFCILSTPGRTAGRYTYDFEHEVQYNDCRSLACTVVQKTRENYVAFKRQYWQETQFVSEFVQGPLGTETRYRAIPAHTATITGVDRIPPTFGCSACGRNYAVQGRPLPKVTIQQEGNTKVMTISEPCCLDCFQEQYFKPCEKPRLSGNLEVIFRESTGDSWEKRLKSMWGAARRLDMRDHDQQRDNTEVVRTSEEVPFRYSAGARIVTPPIFYEGYQEESPVDVRDHDQQRDSTEVNRTLEQVPYEGYQEELPVNTYMNSYDSMLSSSKPKSKPVVTYIVKTTSSCCCSIM